MDTSRMAKDIPKAGGKIWHLKSLVIDIWFVREAEVSVLMGETFLLLMHKKTDVILSIS